MPKRTPLLGTAVAILAGLTGTLLLVAPFSGHARGASNDDLLAFVLAEQAKTCKAVANVQYVVRVTGGDRDLESKDADTYANRAEVIRQGDKVWASAEVHQRCEFDGGARENHNAYRTVLNEEYAALWGDISRNQLTISYFADCGSAVEREGVVGKGESAALENPIKRMFGCRSGTIEHLVEWEQQLDSEHRSTWTVEQVEENGSELFVITRRTFEGFVDLTFKVDPTKGFVVTEAVGDLAGDGSYVSVERSTYEKHGDRWFPSKMHLTTHEKGELVDEVEVEFTDVVFNPSLNQERFTLAGLDLPEESLVRREKLGGADSLELYRWRKGALVPTGNFDGATAIVVGE